ncbi:hypothetical protein [Paraglaciecola hydrolytica]|uniref:Type II secretory pathway component n=1 Tax=Paraglaciecola hydrolytica TaxID=1799789 RepID=A0A136A4F0_9ALTE|nr:hypothetical protein [Paraglaciecola hydrolytica]KXI30113.1 hypothetical protein AX660_08940 [Paraglaciecola hydrolytica]
MCLKITAPSSFKKQRGSMLVIALFVIVVLAFLGLTLTKLLSGTNDNVIYEVLGQRAHNAARTGIECRLAEAFPIVGATAYCSTATPPNFDSVKGFENCRYDSTASTKIVKDGSKSLNYVQFSSTGTCEVGNIVVSRTVYIDAIM